MSPGDDEALQQQAREAERARTAREQELHSARETIDQERMRLKALTPSRATALAITKLEEARMWLGVAAFDGG